MMSADCHAWPELARPELARPELARPELARPELARPELARPELVERVEPVERVVGPVRQVQGMLPAMTNRSAG
ncbi:MAG: hypothetical protein IIA53_10420 [Chloroflexi bacterium]|nr:hypothetical protein [Chloroflexota bacterium]